MLNQSKIYRIPSINSLIVVVSGLLLLHISCCEGNFHLLHDTVHYPCHFLDSVNITESRRFANGSYLYDGIIIPPYLVGKYDFEIVSGLTKIPAEPHMRGCICKIKPCIKFCCPPDQEYNNNASACMHSMDLNYLPEMNITMSNGSMLNINVLENFSLQVALPCSNLYFLTPQWADYDQWELFQNGTLLREDDQTYMYKDEYCIAPQKINIHDTVYVLNPMNCISENDKTTKEVIFAYTMLFSVPFMIITIVVYLSIPELRNQHGKSLSCYLLGLVVGYSVLSFISIASPSKLSELTCKTLGFVAYYSFMASFFWLNVISFDLWHNFRGTLGINRFLEKKRFLKYSAYAWGVPLGFFAYTWCAQHSPSIPLELKPGIGGGDFCWLDMRGWQAMIYFFGPILIIMVVNITMFVMTALKIHHVQKEMSRIMAREDSTKNLRTEKDRFGLFLRLFIVMGVTWSLEIISYFVGTDTRWSQIFYVSDICNAIQGFVIFTLFVMKKKVKHLITNRCRSSRANRNQRQSQYSNKTTSSSVTNLTLNSVSAEKPLILERNNMKL